jgi:hypothetical protein
MDTFCIGDDFRFGSIFIKKSNKTEFFLKKPKPVQTGLARFFWFDSVFPGFFGFGSVRFFDFRLIKPNRSVFSKF